MKNKIDIKHLHKSDLWEIKGVFDTGEIKEFFDYSLSEYGRVTDKRRKRLKKALVKYYRDHALAALDRKNGKTEAIDAIHSLYFEALDVINEDYQCNYPVEVIEALDDDDLKIIMRLNGYKLCGKY